MIDSTGEVPKRLDWEDLPGLFPAFAGPDRWLKLLRAHAALVADWNERLGLTSVTAAERVRRNYAESLETWRIARARVVPRVVIDVGTGAGFPGLVVACVEPGLEVNLVEPLRKRAQFLQLVASSLGLERVAVYSARAEEAGRGPLRAAADVVLARAVAPLPALLEYTAPLAREGGWLVLPKGSAVEEEVGAAGAALAALGCVLREVVATRPAVSATPWVVTIEKVGETPERYPRRPGRAARRPLP